MSGIATSPRLPLWSAAFAAQRAGTTLAKIALMGDSTTGGANGSGALYTANEPFSLATRIGARLTALGYGINRGNLTGTSNTSSTSNSLPYDARVSFDAGTGWALGASSPYGMTGGFITFGSTTEKMHIAFADAFDTIDIWYRAVASGGSINVAVDGGANIGSAVSTTGTLALTKMTKSCTLGVHTVDISTTASGATTQIESVIVTNSTSKKINIYNWSGFSWSPQTQWAYGTGPYNALTVIPQYAPDLTIFTGINGTPDSTYGVAMQSIITACKATGDMILVNSTPNSAHTEAQSQYRSAVLRGLAAANNCRFINILDRWGGTVASANTLGFLTGDNVHLSLAGGADVTTAIMSAILTP